MGDKLQQVANYFETYESRFAYRILKGVKHMGYFPERQENIKVSQAQNLLIEKLYEKLALGNNFNPLLLDAGCGEGNVALYLARKYKYNVIGVDLLDFSLYKANRNRDKLGLSKYVEFRLMDYENLDFKENMFDAVFTLETLVHAPDYMKALKEFFRILRPRGKLALFEYSMAPLENIPPQTRKICEIILEGSGMHSLRFFLHDKFPQTLKDAGFTQIEVENITPRIVPFFKKFYPAFYLPYQLIKLFGAQKRFVNLTSAVEGYENIIKNDYWRYNIVTARKPS